MEGGKWGHSPQKIQSCPLFANAHMLLTLDMLLLSNMICPYTQMGGYVMEKM